MIKLKLSFGKDSSEQEFQIESGELLRSAIERATKEVPLGEFKLEDVFNTVVNGISVESDFWDKVKLKPEDIVLVTPKLKDGDSGQIFKQILIIGVAIAASAIFPPASFTAVGSGLLVAGVTIAASLALNALIPPPNPDLGGGIDLGGSDIADSQMYSITGQSNEMKRLGTVPKVYGSHRVFPTLATIPYTELSVNPASGEIVQYLCGIYDFGLGSPKITDLAIGDTPFSSEAFDDFQYRLVDPNRPDTDQDEFDAPLNKEFTLYKGDRSTAQLSFDLLDGTEVIQNSRNNPDSLKQEILLDFACPRGLYSYSSGGDIGLELVNLHIDFAPVGSSDWKPYNDLTAVDSYDLIGGTEIVQFSYPIVPLLPTDVLFSTYFQSNTYTTGNYANEFNYIVDVSTKQGTNKLLVSPTSGADSWQVGRQVFYYQEFIGVIQSIATVSGHIELTLDRAFNSKSAYQYRGHIDAPTLAVPSPVPVISGDAYNVFNIRSSASDPSLASIRSSKTTPIYASFRFTPKALGQFQVRVRRVSSSGSYNQQVVNDTAWVALSTAFSRTPINTTKRHVFLEIRVKATNQLNGNIQNLSAVATQPVDVYDPDSETWSRQISSNPAWVFVDLLTGEVNKKAVAKTRLHLPSILAWADYCDAIPDSPPGQDFLFPRFSCNFLLDFDTTLQGLLQQVGGAAQASLNIIDGKYGVLVDRLKTTPIQIFTPRNSKDFTSTRFYSQRPDGVNVKYIDPQLGWEISEVAVYDNGFNQDNAINLEDMTSFACTSQEQAWRFGRYMIAQNKLRQETINLLVDFENLICTRGDYVQVCQDVMQVGGRPARVKSVSGSDIGIDDALDIDPDIEYGYTYRSAIGEIKTSTLTPIDARTFTVDGDIPAVGDLIVIGEVGKIVIDCIVKSINPNDDMSAQLSLVERANEIFDYESSGVLPEYDPQISQTSRPDFSPPKAVVGLAIDDLNWECAETQSGYNYFVQVSWDIPPGSVYENFEVWFDDGRGYKLAASTSAKYFKTNIDQTRLGYPHGIKVVAVAASGKKLQLVEMPEVTFTPVVKNTSPSDVTNFGMSITNQTLQLTWDFIADCDANKYEIRYSPDTNDVWEASTPLQLVDRNVNSVTVQARTGVYFIKAVDFAGNKSANASETITTIPGLFDLNVIETFNDAPGFIGQYEQTEKLGDAIVLRIKTMGDVNTMEFFPEGNYIVFDLLDLGDIYSVRLASYIRADGYRYGELMSSWDHLSDVDHLTTAESDDWNITAEYRATNEILAMSDWAHLADIDHINEGVGAGFTGWRPIPAIGDATGRVFQFRVRLESLTPNVTPRLFDATIKADMPDRVDTFENLLSSATDPYTVTYEKRFRGPSTSPNVQISIDDGATGDYWTFTNKNLEGFQIRFYDKLGAQVARRFDVAAKGYGSRHTVTI